MRIIKENVNLSALLLFLLILIPFDYILFGAFLDKKIERPYSIVLLFFLMGIESICLIIFSKKNIYSIEFNENGINIKFKFKNIEKKYKTEDIQKVSIFYSQMDSMNNINFYLNDDSKFSIPTSEKDDLKKVYRFFKDKAIECKVVGLPSGRAPEDYNW